MKVLFNLPSRENELFRDEINSVLKKVLDSGYYLLGNHVKSFEDEFAEYCGTKYCVSLGNGTDALEIGLRSLGVSRGDEVVTVANAGAYSTTACNLIGAIPVYVDVNESDLLLNLKAAVDAISSKTVCVVVTHLYGQAVNVLALRKLLDEAGFKNVLILEDCAQAHGATVSGRKVGSMGDVATFSFYPTKNLGALGDGGAIVTQDGGIADRCLQFRQYGWVAKYNCAVPYGRNSRLDEMQAAILRVKLRHLDELNEKRAKANKFLYNACKDYVDVITKPSEDHVNHLFVVKHENRDAIRSGLASKGIATDIHYPILDVDQRSMQSIPFLMGDLKHSKEAARTIFSLPCYAGIESQELEYIGSIFSTSIAKLCS